MKLKPFYAVFTLCFQIVFLTVTCAFWIHSHAWDDSVIFYTKSSDFLWISSSGGMVRVARGHDSGRTFGDGTVVYNYSPGRARTSEWGVTLHRWQGVQWARTTMFSHDAHVIWVAYWLIALVAAASLSRRLWLMMKARRERAGGFEPLTSSSGGVRDDV